MTLVLRLLIYISMVVMKKMVIMMMRTRKEESPRMQMSG